MTGVVDRVVPHETKGLVEKQLMAGAGSLRKIAEDCDVSHEYVRTVRVKLEKDGVRLPTPKRMGSPRRVDIATLRQLFNEGKTRQEIAELLGVSPRTISRLKRENHIAPTLHGTGRRIGAVEIRNIVLAYEGGKSILRIAKDYSAGPMRIRRILKNAGTEIRSRGAR